MNYTQNPRMGGPCSVVIIDEHATVTGGATRVAIDEAVALSAAGISVVYLAAIGPISMELQYSKVQVVLLEQHQLTDAWRHPTAALQGIWNTTAYRAMEDVLEQLDPDSTVIHVHSYSKTISASPVRCAVDRGFSVIATLHDYFAACPNGGFFDYPAGETCRRVPLSRDCIFRNCDKRNYANKVYRVTKAYVQREFSGMPGRVTNFIALSESSLSLIRPYLPRESQLFILPNPCSVSKTPPIDAATHSLVAVVGRLSPEKGIELIVRAAQLAGTKLLFIGDGPLRKTAEAGGTHSVTGWVSRTEVYSLFERVRCLVLPSLVAETYGLSVVDAAARGIPSIVTDICGVAERISHGQTGWRIPANDLDSLATSLTTITNDNLVSTVGRAAYTAYWAAPLTLDVHIKDLLQIYRRVLDQRTRNVGIR